MVPKCGMFLLLTFSCMFMHVGSTPSTFLGQISMFSFDFADKYPSSTSWVPCNGQLLPINQNQALFALLGTTYGGDGQTNFALPDLRGRTPIGYGNDYVLGQVGGEMTHMLTSNEIPYSSYSIHASVQLPTNSSCGSTPALAQVNSVCDAETYPSSFSFAPSPTTQQARNNMQKSVPIYFMISTTGIFPSQYKRENEEDYEDEVLHNSRDPSTDGVAFVQFMPYNFAPKGYATAAGQLLPLSQNTALFSLLGTNYGGDGKSTFQLPDLRGKTVTIDELYGSGMQSGSAQIQLAPNHVPYSSYTASFTAVGSNDPRYCATGQTAFVAKNACSSTPTETSTPVATSAQPHNNMQPYLALNAVISLQGVFPQRSKRDNTKREYAYPYTGEIMLFAGNFPPNNFALCDGQLLSVFDYPALFDLLGTMYGGDGAATFGVPDLRDAIPIGVGTLAGTTFVAGNTVGSNEVTLTSQNIPSTTFSGTVTSFKQKEPSTSCPSNNNFNAFQVNNICADDSTFTVQGTGNYGVGGPQPFDIRKPTVAMNYVICLSGYDGST